MPRGPRYQDSVAVTVAEELVLETACFHCEKSLLKCTSHYWVSRNTEHPLCLGSSTSVQSGWAPWAWHLKTSLQDLDLRHRLPRQGIRGCISPRACYCRAHCSSLDCAGSNAALQSIALLWLQGRRTRGSAVGAANELQLRT